MEKIKVKKESSISVSNQIFLVVALLAVLVSCSQNNEPNDELKKAFQYHQEALKIRNQIKDDLNLKYKGDSLEADYRKKLDSISLAIDNWDEQLIEVPGFDEEHDHSEHDHHHHHDQTPDLTSKQHLELQEFLFQEIKEIEKKLSRLD